MASLAIKPSPVTYLRLPLPPVSRGCQYCFHSRRRCIFKMIRHAHFSIFRDAIFLMSWWQKLFRLLKLLLEFDAGFTAIWLAQKYMPTLLLLPQCRVKPHWSYTIPYYWLQDIRRYYKIYRRRGHQPQRATPCRLFDWASLLMLFYRMHCFSHFSTPGHRGRYELLMLLDSFHIGYAEDTHFKDKAHYDFFHKKRRYLFKFHLLIDCH